LPALPVTMLIFSSFCTLITYGAFAAALEHWEASCISAVLAANPILTLLAVFGFSTIFPALLPPRAIHSSRCSGCFACGAGILYDCPRTTTLFLPLILLKKTCAQWR
jgi:hypothetical protein